MQKYTANLLATILLTVSALSYAEVDSVLKKECLSNKNKNLLSCTKIAVNLTDNAQRKKYLDLACPLNSEKYEPIACGIIGVDSMPELTTDVDGDTVIFTNNNTMYSPDLKKAKVYLQRACMAHEKDNPSRERHCIAHKAVVQKLTN